MRRKDKHVSDLPVLHSVINQAAICRIAFVKDDRPYVIPLNFGFDGEHIYFHSATSGEKVDILKQNSNVCLEFEQGIDIIENEKPCEWSARYLTVIIHGRAELVSGIVEKAYGLNQIWQHFKSSAEPYPFTEEELKPVLVYKVVIEGISGKISGM